MLRKRASIYGIIKAAMIVGESFPAAADGMGSHSLISKARPLLRKKAARRPFLQFYPLAS
jgi:hypothetical protein